jgi:hypothetical protein
LYPSLPGSPSQFKELWEGKHCSLFTHHCAFLSLFLQNVHVSVFQTSPPTRIQ